jgi:hypothetical protein
VPKQNKINTCSNCKLLSQFLGLLLLFCQLHSAEDLISRSTPYKKKFFKDHFSEIPGLSRTCGYPVYYLGLDNQYPKQHLIVQLLQQNYIVFLVSIYLYTGQRLLATHRKTRNKLKTLHWLFSSSNRAHQPENAGVELSCIPSKLFSLQ